MKLNFFFILALLSLYSCGGGQSSIKLEVTRSFSTGNSTFDGGLLIIAKNSVSGEEYYAPLATQSTVSLNLNYGTWDITAVGWDNDPDLFEGDILCGSTTKVFSKEVDTAPISVSSANCSSPKLLKILTCGALFDPADPTKLISGTNLSDVFCSHEKYHQVFNEMRPGSIKISLPKKLPGESLGEALVSACIVPSNDPGLPFNTSKKFPDNAPFIVNVYQDSACTEIKAKYHFTKGTLSYDPSTHDFDAVIKNVTTSSNTSDSTTTDPGRIIALASPESKRGRTSFVTEIPQFKCTPTNGKCASLPPLPTGIQYIVSNGYNRLIIETNLGCSDITFGTSFINSGSTSCTELSGTKRKIEFEIQVTQYPGTTIPTDITLFTLGSGTNNIVKGLYKDRELHVYREIAQTIGVSTTPPSSTNNDIKDSIQEGDEKDLSYLSNGILTEIADMLSPSKIGGMFLGHICSTSALNIPISKEITVQEDGEEKKYKISIINPPTSYNVPKYMRYSSTSNPWIDNTTLSYNRRIVLSLFVGPVGYKTEMVLDLVCDGNESFDSGNIKRIGKLERQKYEINSSGEINKHKSIMHWNTNVIGQHRIEAYNIEEKGLMVNGTDVINDVRTNFNRAEDTLFGTSSKVKITSMGYEYANDYNSNNYTESLFSHDINITGTDISVFDGDYIKKVSTSQGNIFSDNYKMKEKNKIRFNNETNLDSVKSAGAKMLSVVKGVNGLIVKHFNGTNYIEHTITTNYNLFDFDISPDGSKAAIVTTGTGSSILYGYFYDTGTGTWNISSPESTTLYGSPSKISVRIMNNGETHLGALITKSLHVGISNTPSLKNLSLFAGGTTNTNNQTITEIKVSDIENYDVVRNGSKFWVFLHESLDITRYTQGFNYPPSKDQYLKFCKINYSSPNCSLITLDQANLNYSESIDKTFSLFEAPLGNEIFISYFKTASGVNKEFFKKWTIGNDGTIAENFGYQNLNLMTGVNTAPLKMTTTNIQSIGNEVNILIPFKQASEPNFKMNYMSLNPAHMKTYIFTSPTTFENIGQ